MDIISASLRSRLAPARNTGDERPASAAPPQAPALRAAQVPGTRERTRMRTAVPPGKQRRVPGRWNADANRGRGARESRGNARWGRDAHASGRRDVEPKEPGREGALAPSRTQPSTAAKPQRKAGRNHKRQGAEVTSGRERGREWQGNFWNPGHGLFFDLRGSDMGVPFMFICKTTKTLLCFSVLCWELCHNLNPKWT